VQQYSACVMCKVWVLGKHNITLFNVITFRINGKMIIEVYSSIIFCTTICCLISAFLDCVLHHVCHSSKPCVRLYFVNLYVKQGSIIFYSCVLLNCI